MKINRTRVINFYANNILYSRIRRQIKRFVTIHLKSADQTVHIESTDNPPIIVIGMHRSGTTLLSRLLRKSGVQMGWLKGNDTDESLFFQNINKSLFRIAHSYWDEPKAFKYALQNDRFKSAAVNAVSSFLKTSSSFFYFGKLRKKEKGFSTIPFRWGWKDPRNTYSLPIWLSLFPNAKVIFIYRNGLDVANSLYTRNEKLLKNSAVSVGCLTLEGAFKIWEEYNTECLESVSKLHATNIHTIKYEDLIQNPVELISQIHNFLEIKLSEKNIQEIASGVRKDRAYNFVIKPELMDLYYKTRGSKLVEEFGYNNIPGLSD